MFCGMHLWVSLQEVLKNSIYNMNCKITLLKLVPHCPGAQLYYMVNVCTWQNDKDIITNNEFKCIFLKETLIPRWLERIIKKLNKKNQNAARKIHALYSPGRVSMSNQFSWWLLDSKSGLIAWNKASHKCAESVTKILYKMRLQKKIKWQLFFYSLKLNWIQRKDDVQRKAEIQSKQATGLDA